MSIAEKLTAVAENQQQVFDAGKAAEQNNFWEIFQNGGSRTNYAYAFQTSAWTDEIYNPKYDFRLGTANVMFGSSQITNIKKTIDVSGSSSNKVGLFQNCTKLTTIPKVIVNENNSYSDWFLNCPMLTNISFEGVIGKDIDFKGCNMLSKESIEGIVNCLSGSAEGKTLTLSQNAVNNAFSSQEWDTLTLGKANWSFMLK